MKKISIVSLLVLGIIGAVLAGVLELGLAVSGKAIIVPPLTLAVTLAIFGAIIIAVAWPIRRAVVGKSTSRLDPFYALRVVMLAQASALGGALLVGAGVGVVIYLLSLPVVPSSSSIVLAFATIVGAAILLAGGLIAEYMCRIPPRDDNDNDEPDGPGDGTVRVRP
jgi:hypothetical protein